MKYIKRSCLSNITILCTFNKRHLKNFTQCLLQSRPPFGKIKTESCFVAY